MAQQEQQPEEAVTRPVAAGAQFAGNFTQTSMYGRAMAGRNNPGEQKPGGPTTRRSADRPDEKAVANEGKTAQQPDPDVASTLTLQDDPALRQLIGRLDPVEELMWRAERPPGQPWGPEPAPPVIEPGIWTWAETEAAEDTPTAAGDPEPPALAADEDEHEIPPVDGDDPFLLGAELDSAAAQQRLQIGQVEPPPVTPPGPALGPGPV